MKEEALGIVYKLRVNQLHNQLVIGKGSSLKYLNI